jgi:hypothetical protein
MILWVDDTRNPPNRFDYLWASTVRQAIMIIEDEEQVGNPLEYLDLDHDAGDYFFGGGDYIRLLDWLESTGRNYPIRIHSMNPVGVANMRAIIEKNNWKEIR